MTARNNGLPASEKKKRAGSIAKHISFTGVFAALCFVATVIVKIPQPSGGYFNLGDAFVLLSGWFLGPAYGAVAAGLGCALADLALDGAIYAPATLVIKAAMAVLAYFIAKLFKKFIKKEKFDVLPRILSALAAEAVMVGGYFFYEAVCLGLGLGAAAGIVSNVLQGLVALFGSALLVGALYPLRPVRNFFPKLG